MIRVMIVDDQQLIRAGLRVVIESAEDFAVVADVSDGFLALEALASESVDVVLMDLRMPGIDGVETTRRIRQEHPDGPPVLVMTTFDQDQNVLAALRAGASGFLSKGADAGELLGAIRAVHEGSSALSSSAVDAVVSHIASPQPLPPADPEMALLFAHLTPREHHILGLVIEGLDNAEIARRESVSPFTVKTHVNRAMAKVDARDRAQLIAFALRAGLHQGG